MVTTRAAQMAIEMGYDERFVMSVISNHVQKTGNEFSSPEQLLEAVMEAENMSTKAQSTRDRSDGQVSRQPAGSCSHDVTDHVKISRKKPDSYKPTPTTSSTCTIVGLQVHIQTLVQF